MAAVFGMIGLSLMELRARPVRRADRPVRLRPASACSPPSPACVLGVFMLIMDFDFVEQGIRNGLPERESWRAAFAMTVSLVWIYTNLLRLLAIFSSD